jgi:hypothetical protein
MVHTFLGNHMYRTDLRGQLKLRKTEECKYFSPHLKFLSLWYIFEGGAMIVNRSHCIICDVYNLQCQLNDSVHMSVVMLFYL